VFTHTGKQTADGQTEGRTDFNGYSAGTRTHLKKNNGRKKKREAKDNESYKRQFKK